MDYKKNRLDIVRWQLNKLGYTVVDMDYERPWGGFFRISDDDIKPFIARFFPELSEELLNSELPLSPKILCVAPGKKLSWQFHYRRSEIWKLIDGKAAYILSDSDDENALELLENGLTLVINKEQRHRLVGLNEWGIIAEIWRHTDPTNPSDEDDIIRLRDDFGR